MGRSEGDDRIASRVAPGTAQTGSRPDRQSPFRTIAFAILVIAVLVGVLLGVISPRAGASPRQTAELYTSAGDTFMRLVYLMQDPQPDSTDGAQFLDQAFYWYRQSLRADPTDVNAATSYALVLHELGKGQEAVHLLAGILPGARSPDQQEAILSTFKMVAASEPAESDVATAAGFLRDLAPGPMALSRAYDRMGEPELARQEWEAGAAEAEALLRPILALLSLTAAMALAGLTGLVITVVRRLRRTREDVSPGGAIAAPAAWGLQEAVESLVIWVFVAAGVGILSGRWAPADELKGVLALLLPGLVAGIAAIGWVLVAAPRPRSLGWSWHGWWRNGLSGVLAGAVVTIPVLALYLVIPQERPLVSLFVVTSGWQARALLAAMACLAFPAVEETLFRGILYRGLRREWGVAPAAALSGLIFAVGHVFLTGIPSAVALLPYLVLGVLFAYLYERSGSLVSPWAAHVVFNGFNTAILMAMLS